MSKLMSRKASEELDRLHEKNKTIPESKKMEMMNFYVTGIQGMLGKACQKVMKEKNISFGGCDIIDNPFSKIDIMDYEKLKEDIEITNPEIILHCAVMVNVDECEKDKNKCFEINIEGTENIIRICQELNIKLIYISTSAVFDGEKGNYNEDDIPNPVNVYAESKYIAEHKIQEGLKNYLIIRTNIFGWAKGQFAEWIIESLLAGKEFDLFEDSLISLIYVEDLVRILLQIKKESGIINATCKEVVNKYTFGKMLAECYGYNSNMIKSIKMENHKMIAKRPRNISLNISKLQTIITNIPSLKQSIKEYKMNRGFYTK